MKVALFVLLLLSFWACSEDRDANFIARLGPNEKKFPQNYFTQDTLYVIDSTSGNLDTFLLRGKAIERYVNVDNHTSGGSGYTTSHEVLQKTFKSEDGQHFLTIMESNMADSPFPDWGGGFVIRADNYGFSFQLYDVEDTQADQNILSYYSDKDTIVYNTIQGIRSIKLRSVQQPRTISFYP